MAHNSTTDYCFLGKSGLKVSNVCLGSLTFQKIDEGLGANSSPTQLKTEEDVYKLLDRFVELGGNFIDTANIYGKGRAETMIGNWLSKKNRDDVVIASKVRFRMSDKPNDIGLSRRHIMQSVEESLKRLQTDYIDLYQAHMWDSATPIEETFRAFDDLVRCGKIRYIGVSNLNGWRLQKVVDTIKYAGMNPVVSLQQQYSLLCRYPEFEELEVCTNEGIGVIPWSPLKGGLLTGKYKRGEVPDPNTTRIGHVAKDEKRLIQLSAPAWSSYSDNDNYWKIIDKLSSISKKHGL
ncbi:hypothetical protein KUTeg_018611 [Tegillarca granosa]|uniref:NADP-dependent oxidoreductase domain-containing protein n=1 Tax=Tegillarca granosa TaxID=220873 RepID=A0ABQ9EET2_TEGGR|nr:hypothetical protein KUTeg_018611 [Tegillarca granosa]